MNENEDGYEMNEVLGPLSGVEDCGAFKKVTLLVVSYSEVDESIPMGVLYIY